MDTTKYRNTVRADWLDPVVNAVGNLFEDAQIAQALLDQDKPEDAKREAGDAMLRFVAKAKADGADVEDCCSMVNLGRVSIYIKVAHPNGGVLEMTYRARRLDD
jgi:hypothetical protein